MKKSTQLLFLICLMTIVFLNPVYGQFSPKNEKGLTNEVKEAGKMVFINTCAVCHGNNATVKVGGPSIGLLAGMTSRAIYSAITVGKMQTQAATLTDEQKKAVAQFIANQAMVETNLPKKAFIPFSLPQKPAYVSGWGGNLEGTGFNAQSKINSTNVGTLKQKWVFAFPDGTMVRSKPAVVGDWLIVGSQFGDVYALHKKTGKIGWQFKGDAAIRGAISVAQTTKGLRVYFADFATNVYALDINTGKLLWKQRAGVHSQSANTGSVAVYQNTIIVPITSFEVGASKDPNFDCCTSSGEVVALNATTGEIKWRHRVIPEEAKESGMKTNGKPFYGPSGAIVWCSPTIDTKRGLIYIGTGENYTDPPTNTSDAIQAIDIKTGKLVWNFQATAHDTWNLACPGEPNCPDNAGPDLDFGMAPILVKNVHSAKDILVVGQKSGVVYALEPATGKILWQKRVGKGGALGGIHWGMATDGKTLYVANADNLFGLDMRDSTVKPAPGLYALNLSNGDVIWKQAAPSCNGKEGCIEANSAAPLLLSDIALAGALDGHIRAYDTKNGTILWDFDTMKEFETVNGIKGMGGSIDGPSPVASEDMLFVNSGYSFFGEKTGNVLIAFELERK